MRYSDLNDYSTVTLRTGVILTRIGKIRMLCIKNADLTTNIQLNANDIPNVDGIITSAIVNGSPDGYVWINIDGTIMHNRAKTGVYAYFCWCVK